MTKLFLKTLSLFYYDQMVASVPSDFIEMVNMGLILEEGVHEGRLKENGSTESSRKYGIPKKKEHDANAISQEKHMRLPRNNQHHQHVAFVTPVINSAPVGQATPSYQPCFQQRTNQQNQQNCGQRPVQFDPIPMTYTKLFPALFHKNLV